MHHEQVTHDGENGQEEEEEERQEGFEFIRRDGEGEEDGGPDTTGLDLRLNDHFVELPNRIIFHFYNGLEPRTEDLIMTGLERLLREVRESEREARILEEERLEEERLEEERLDEERAPELMRVIERRGGIGREPRPR